MYLYVGHWTFKVMERKEVERQAIALRNTALGTAKSADAGGVDLPRLHSTDENGKDASIAFSLPFDDKPVHPCLALIVLCSWVRQCPGRGFGSARTGVEKIMHAPAFIRNTI